MNFYVLGLIIPSNFFVYLTLQVGVLSLLLFLEKYQNAIAFYAKMMKVQKFNMDFSCADHRNLSKDLQDARDQDRNLTDRRHKNGL